jgi:hypothetical protein
MSPRIQRWEHRLARLLVGLLVLATAPTLRAHQGLPEGDATLVHACSRPGRHGKVRMRFVAPTGSCPRKWTPVHFQTNVVATTTTTTILATPATLATTTTTLTPEWTPVREDPHVMGLPNPCGTGQTGVFCGFQGASFYGYFNYGGQWASAAFYKDALGVVHLKGLVRNYNAEYFAQTIFILPEGHRPGETRLFGTMCYDSDQHKGGICRVDISPTGQVTFIDSAGILPVEFLTLDGISFRAE